MTEILERPIDSDGLEKLYADSPNAHQRFFGSQEIRHLPLDSLIMLSQVRGDANPIHDDLKESIDHEDLDNPINVARVTPRELARYILCTNRLWDSSVRLRDLAGKRQEDGLFNLVAGGHSRTVAIMELADEHTERTGESTDWHVQAKLLKDTSVYGIAQKQMSENLHKGAPIEREAMAVVELYQVGLGTEWNDTKSFQKAMKGKLKKSTINASVAFHSLPPEIRAQVFKKELPFIAGVALGRGVESIRNFFMTTAGYTTEQELDKEARQMLADSVTDKIVEYASHMTNQELKPSTARFYVLSQVKSLQSKADKILAARSKDAEVVIDDSLFGDDDFAMIDPKVELRKLRDKARRDRIRRLEEIAHGNNQRTTEIILSMSPTEDKEAHEKLLQDVKASKDVLERDLQRRVNPASFGEQVDIALAV